MFKDALVRSDQKRCKTIRLRAGSDIGATSTRVYVTI